MQQRPTLADIADQAGVSTATVSRVLNGKSNVADVTRQQVLVALDLLGYERPESLRRSSRGLVGLVVPELSNPIFPAYAQQIEQLLAASGRTPLLCTQTPGGTSEDEYIEMLVNRGVSGIIFVSGRHADTGGDVTRYQRLRERGVPLVTINGNAPTIRVPGFTTDDRAAARVAVEHLISLGHRRIGLATGPLRMVPAQRKRAGYADAMRSGLPDQPLRILETLYTYEGGATAADRLVDEGCTGIICGSDIMALGAISGARSRGLRVPDDLSIIGYDDTALIPMTNPPLTTVRQPVAAICRAAVTTLMSIDRRRGDARRGDALRPRSHRARVDDARPPIGERRVTPGLLPCSARRAASPSRTPTTPFPASGARPERPTQRPRIGRQRPAPQRDQELANLAPISTRRPRTARLPPAFQATGRAVASRGAPADSRA